LSDATALFVTLASILSAFGQIPINEYMIGKMIYGPFRARIYSIRYVVAFSVLALALPIIAFVHKTWGLDTLFQILAAAFPILIAVSILPKNLQTGDSA
jgi:hypothetical protein